MTQHSQNCEGVEVIQSDRDLYEQLCRPLSPDLASALDRGELDGQQKLQAVASYRQSLTAREPDTADVGRIMGCHSAVMGEYAGQIELVPPQHLPRHDGRGVCVDACLALEITALWAAGIHTTGCCCGHGVAPAYIGVAAISAEQMAAAGYGSAGNGDLLAFRPKTGCAAALSRAAPSSGHAMAEGEREGCTGSMDPKRATYFLERFKREGKLLGPHEKWALDYTIAILATLSTTPPATNDAKPITYQSAADCPLGSAHGSASTHGDANGVDCCDFCGFPSDDQPATNDAIPAGWKLVPVECADAMIAKAMAWFTSWSHMRKQDRRNAIANAWSSMLSIVPSAPATSDRLPGQWQTMRNAPDNGTEFWALSDDMTGNDLPPFVSKCAWHPDAGFCTDELRQPILWRPLAPAEAIRDGGEGGETA